MGILIRILEDHEAKNLLPISEDVHVQKYIYLNEPSRNSI